jgi:hypothetical protein
LSFQQSSFSVRISAAPSWYRPSTCELQTLVVPLLFHTPQANKTCQVISLGLKLENIEFSEQFAKSIRTCNGFEWELVVDLEGIEGRRI